MQMRNKGVKYVYLQPLTNLESGIIDFDILDIMLSTSDKKDSEISSIHFDKSHPTKDFSKNSIPFRSEVSNFSNISTIPKSNIKLFEGSTSQFDNKDSIMNKPNKSKHNNNYFKDMQQFSSITSVGDDQFNLNFDCISKIYDLEGDLALKVHDNPSDNLNSIKFFDPELGTNWSKLHTGETIFNLDQFLDRSFSKNYNSRKKFIIIF